MESRPKNILALCGSTRDVSVNLHIIKTLEKLAGNTWYLSIYDLTALPYFNQDITDEHVEESVIQFRQSIEKSDGVLICTPEYVFSLPGIVKNALEWTVSTTVFSDKPTALITASSSGQKAHESLILVMKTLGVKTSDELCLLISGVKSKLNTTGDVIDNALLEKLNGIVNALNQ